MGQNKFLEQITRKLNPRYRDSREIPKVHILGNPGAGKSKFLSAVHKDLGLIRTGVTINHSRPKTHGVRHPHLVSEIVSQRDEGIQRMNATVRPESMRYWCYSSKGFVPIELHTEGAHPNVPKLRGKLEETGEQPDLVVLCLDLLYFQHYMDDVWSEAKYMSKGVSGCNLEEKTYKLDSEADIVSGLLSAIDDTVYWHSEGVPVVYLVTHMSHEAVDDQIKTRIRRDISDGTEVHLQEMDKVFVFADYEPSQRGNLFRGLSKILLPVDTIIPASNSMFLGIIHAASEIARTATGLDELKVVGFYDKHNDLANGKEYSKILTDYRSVCNGEH
jgi:hypothetical protein